MRANRGFNGFTGSMRFRWFAVSVALAMVLATVPISSQLQSGSLAGAGTIPGLNPNAPHQGVAGARQHLRADGRVARTSRCPSVSTAC